MGLVVPRAAPADNAFRGTSRKDAKLSLADADTEVFDDLKDLIDTLEAHNVMKEHPDLSTDKNNDRSRKSSGTYGLPRFSTQPAWKKTMIFT